MSIASRITSIEEHIGDTYDVLELGGFKPILVPSEYKQLDYIESGGTQYINTGVLNNGYKSETEIAWTNIATRQIMGAYSVGFFGINNDGYYEVYQVSNYKAELNRWDKVVFEVTKDSSKSYRTLTVNNNLLINRQESSTMPLGNIYIFSIDTNLHPSGLSLCSCKIKYQKIWDNTGTLVRHFIPCYRKSDNVIGMYDIVNNVFYTNSGTGTFTAGPVTFNKNIENIAPSIKQKYLDYMNNGTQEIWNNWEKVSGTGENVILNNTVQAPMDLGVGGNTSQVQYSGKNLANTPSITTIQSNIRSIDIPCQAEPGSYILSLEEWQTTGTEEVSAIELRNENTAVVYSQIGKTQLIKNLTINSTITKIRIYSQSSYNTSVNAETTITNLMFRKASITDGTYEPYVGGTASPNPSYPQEITNVTGDVEVLVQNKNRFNVTEFDGITQNDDGTFKTTKYYVDTTEVIFKGNPNSQYTISFKENETLNSTGFSLSVNGTWINLTNNGHKYTFTTDSNGETKLKLGAGSYALIGTSNRYIQLEQGSTATTYTPHQEQTYTFPLGTQRMYLGDYLADDGIHHVRKQIVLDGTQNISIVNWRASETSVGWIYPYNIFNNAYVSASDVGQILSDKLIATKYDDLYQKNVDNGIGVYSNTSYGVVVRTSDTTLTTSTLINNYLSENPITVEYELGEEEITPYTTEQQQAYDEIKQAISYEEQTNISGSSDEDNPIFTVVALKNS